MLIAHIKKYSVLYSYVLTALFVAFFSYYFLQNKETFMLLLRVSALYIAGIVVLYVIGKFFVGMRFKIMINFFGTKLGFNEWFGLPCIASMMNSVLPGYAGVATQAVYLKQSHKFEYSKFSGYLTSFLIFNLIVYSLLGMLFIGAHYLLHDVFYFAAFVVFFVLFTSSAIFVALAPVISKYDLRWSLLNKTMQGFHLFFEHKNLLIYLTFIHLVDTILTGARFFLAYKALGAPIDLLPSLALGLVASISTMASITPGGIGIREALLGVASSMLGEKAVFGVVASLLDRAIGILVAFIFGICYVPVLIHKNDR